MICVKLLEYFEALSHNADYVVDSIKYIKLALVNLEHLWYNRNVKKGKYAFLRFLCKKLLYNKKIQDFIEKR